MNKLVRFLSNLTCSLIVEPIATLLTGFVLYTQQFYSQLAQPFEPNFIQLHVYTMCMAKIYFIFIFYLYFFVEFCLNISFLQTSNQSRILLLDCSLAANGTTVLPCIFFLLWGAGTALYNVQQVNCCIPALAPSVSTEAQRSSTKNSAMGSLKGESNKKNHFFVKKTNYWSLENFENFDSTK